jgi:hypothetical protein
MHVIRGENLKPDAEGEDEHEMADDDLFVRDDEAGDAGQKRKRGDEENEAEDEQREQSPTWKAKKTKQFARQQDYISFADEQGGNEDVEDSDEDVQSEFDNEEDDHESVHSESSLD